MFLLAMTRFDREFKGPMSACKSRNDKARRQQAAAGHTGGGRHFDGGENSMFLPVKATHKSIQQSLSGTVDQGAP
jgi:hypothetical protein